MNEYLEEGLPRILAAVSEYIWRQTEFGWKASPAISPQV